MFGGGRELLRDVKARMRPLFGQKRVAVSAGQFLDGLLGSEPRETDWMRWPARTPITVFKAGPPKPKPEKKEKTPPQKTDNQLAA